MLNRFRAHKAEALVAFLVGGIAFASIWLAGFEEVAYLGFVGAAIVWGATLRRRCEPRHGVPRTS